MRTGISKLELKTNIAFLNKTLTENAGRCIWLALFPGLGRSRWQLDGKG